MVSHMIDTATTPQHSTAHRFLVSAGWGIVLGLFGLLLAGLVFHDWLVGAIVAAVALVVYLLPPWRDRRTFWKI